jgi:hypothetical protein
VQEVAADLVKDRYVLAEDLAKLVEHAGEHFDLATRRVGASTR